MSGTSTRQHKERAGKGRKPDKLMRDALSRALHQEAEAANGKPTKKLFLVANALVDKAIAGDVSAIREINDRMDGKVTQPLAGEEEGPVNVRLVLQGPDGRDL